MGSPWIAVPASEALTGRSLAVDLAFERAIFRHPRLSIFRRNASTWEVLLILAAVPEGEGPGLYELVQRVETMALGPSSLLRFLRERRDEGSIVFTRSPQKRSKWTLSLRTDLREALLALLRMRDGV